MTWSNLRFNVWRSFATMVTNLPSCLFIQYLEKLLKFVVNLTLSKYVKSQRSYGFLITKELLFGFQILDLKDHFSASLSYKIFNRSEMLCCKSLSQTAHLEYKRMSTTEQLFLFYDCWAGGPFVLQGISPEHRTLHFSLSFPSHCMTVRFWILTPLQSRHPERRMCG